MTLPPVQRIWGEHIDLIDIQPVYFDVIIAWRNDAENKSFFFTDHVWTLEGQWRWYDDYMLDPTDLTFVILLKSGLPVGTVSVYALDKPAGTAEFGRMLIGEKRYRRQGIAYEAGQLCLDFALNTLGLRKISLEVYEWNAAAIRLYERLGFVCERESAIREKTGQVKPMVRMGLTADSAALSRVTRTPRA